MPSRTTQNSDASLYYITFTCYNWLPLFQLVNAYDIVYKWFNYLKAEKNIKTTAYVILPGHVHAIIDFSNTGKSINTNVSNGKRFIAYDLIKHLQQ